MLKVRVRVYVLLILLCITMLQILKGGIDITSHQIERSRYMAKKIVAYSSFERKLSWAWIADYRDTRLWKRETRYIIIDEPGYYELTEDIIDCTYGCAIYISASNVILDGRGHIIDGVYNWSSKYGIHICNANNVTIRNIVIQEWLCGIWVESSSNVTISYNIVYNNSYGITLKPSSQDNLIANNTIECNERGVYFDDSSNYNIIKNNIIRNNVHKGIVLVSSCNNFVANNTVEANGDIGINLTGDANNNTIVNNTVKEHYYNLYFDYSYNNTIYLNNFMDCVKQYYGDPSENYFTSPRPVIYSFGNRTYTNYTGNYWDNYSGEDTDGDGIGETPCGPDPLPLMGRVKITRRDIIITATPYVRILLPKDGEALNSTTITLRWEAISYEEGIDHFEIYVDGKPVNTSIPPEQTNYTLYLSEGAHTIKIRAIDKADSISSMSIEVIIDVEPPKILIISPPNNFATNNQSVRVEWNSSDNISGIDHYELLLDGKIVNSSVPTGYTYYILNLEVDDGVHSILIRAVDLAGNIAVDHVTIIVDRTPPIINILMPYSGSILNSTEVFIEWNASDMLGIAYYELYLDGILVANISVNQTSYMINISEGIHNLTVRAIDILGNVATDTIEITVDITPPIIHILKPLNTSIFNMSNIVIVWNSSDNLSGIDHYEIFLDSDIILSEIPSEQTNCSLYLEEGRHIIAIWAVDKAGNKNVCVLEISVDKTPPLPWILSPTNNTVYNVSSINVTWTLSDDAVWYCVIIDGKILYNGSETRYYAILEDGKHTIVVRAKDKAGNIGYSMVIITVDTMPPIIHILCPKGRYLNESVVNVSWNIVEQNIKFVQLRINHGEWVAVDDTYYVLKLEDGEYIVEIRVVDAAGHVAMDEVYFTVDTSPPTITILEPKNNSFSENSTISIKISVEDNYGIHGVFIETNSSWKRIYGNTINVELREGTNIISIKAVDKAGNSRIICLIVIYEPEKEKRSSGFVEIIILIGVMVLLIAIVRRIIKKRRSARS